jgi:hypothetical protein
VDVTTGHCGPESDISLFRKQTQKFGDNQQFDGDKGYVGEDNIAVFRWLRYIHVNSIALQNQCDSSNNE